MKTLLNFVLVCVFSVALFSCQKELSFEIPVPGTNPGDNDTTTNPANNKLIGTWKLINLNMSMESRVEVPLVGGTITTYSTVTTNNTGTLTFDATHSKASNMGYDIDTDMTVKTFGAGVPPDEFTVPFQFSVAPYSASSKYKIIGTDSLYFPEGALFEMPDTNGQPAGASEPTGGKFSINGNTLLITASATRDSTVSQGGASANIRQKATVVTKLERQ